MKETAHVAYDAYFNFLANKGLSSLPTWDELPDDVKNAWRAAVEAVYGPGPEPTAP